MTTYHHGDLPAALLRAAGELIEKRGGAALSLREAARAAGVSHNAPYRHFADRDSLLAALAMEGFDLLDQAAAGRSARELGEAYVEFALAHPQRFRLMFGGALDLADHSALRSRAELAHQKLERGFAEFGADAAFAAAATWALMHGLAQIVLDGHFAHAQEQCGGPSAFARKVLGAVRLARAAQRSA
jgi:AcrR family transcriptional regulator